MLFRKHLQRFLTNVLIDTWWNVNLTSTGYVRRDVRVLIDTWWNVNKKQRRMIL